MYKALLVLLVTAAMHVQSFEVRISDEDKYHVHELISKLGKKNMAYLLYHSKHMYGLGDKIDHIPPLQFFGFILQDPYLKECIHDIRSDSVKGWNFMRGFTRRMNEEKKRMGYYQDQLVPFANKFNKDSQLAWRHLDTGNYEEFIAHFLN